MAASWPAALIGATYLVEWIHPLIGRLVNTLAIGIFLCASLVVLRRAKQHLRDALALREQARQLVTLAERVQDSVAPRGPRH